MDTTTLGLKKPLTTEAYDIQIFNDNADKTNELILADRTQINNLDAEVVAHKAENASKHIKESGSNPNGRYIRFDDGTMICYAGQVSMVYLNGSNLQYVWTFPSTFAAVPSISGGHNSPVSGKRAGSYPGTWASATAGYISINCDTSIFASGDTVTAYPIAIGRWKE